MQVDLKEKASDFWTRLDKKQLLIILLIFILAFGVRAHLMKWDLLFGFDGYFHARLAGYVVQNFSIPDKDPLAYYHEGGGYLPFSSFFFWYFTAIIYKIFTLNAPYNKELWIFFVKVLPAIFGALISVSMYFLGKEMYGKKAGITMGVFAALVPSFVYRTMAGFFEEDSLGFLWLVIGFYFFVKAVKTGEFNRESIKNSILSGLFFGIMALTWEMFLLIPLVLISYVFWTLVIMWFKNQSKEKILNFAKLFLISFILFSVIATTFDKGRWIDRATSYVSQYLPVTAENIERSQSRGEGVLAQTVGEEATGNQYFGVKYNALIIFPIVALFLIPYRLLRKKNDNYSLIIFFWTIITLYMAWNKLKFTYTFGLPIAACGGFVFSELFGFLKERTGFEKKAVSIVMLFMLMIGLGAGTFFVTQKLPNIEITPGWKNALNWMREYTPKDAKFFNWWDEGHWITFVGERGVITDNRNLSGKPNSALALFVITDDLNKAYELVKSYGSDHVILSADLISKQGSMVLYAYDTTDFSDPRIRKYFGVGFYCGKRIDELNQQVSYLCGPNTIPEQQMNGIPTVWTPIPNTQLNDRVPAFIYREEDSSKIYIVNDGTNNSMIMRLWMNEPEAIKYFEELYSDGDVKIFKVL